MTTDYTVLTQLGGASAIAASPESAILEKVTNPHLNVDYSIRFTCPEFTSLCPLTGQPDFAHIVIDYVPRHFILESKSLKLFLHSYRNHGDFHEACSVGVAKRIIETIEPTWLRLAAYWYPRGGIPIDVFYQTGDAPKNIWIPALDVPAYRGRG
jgi:7-cyano-7-deazaguanine reductase